MERSKSLRRQICCQRQVMQTRKCFVSFSSFIFLHPNHSIILPSIILSTGMTKWFRGNSSRIWPCLDLVDSVKMHPISWRKPSERGKIPKHGENCGDNHKRPQNYRWEKLPGGFSDKMFYRKPSAARRQCRQREN